MLLSDLIYFSPCMKKVHKNFMIYIILLNTLTQVGYLDGKILPFISTLLSHERALTILIRSIYFHHYNYM